MSGDSCCLVCANFSHFSASPRNGNRLLLDLGFSGSDMLSEPGFSNCTADSMVGL